MEFLSLKYFQVPGSATRQREIRCNLISIAPAAKKKEQTWKKKKCSKISLFFSSRSSYDRKTREREKKRKRTGTKELRRQRSLGIRREKSLFCGLNLKYAAVAFYDCLWLLSLFLALARSLLNHHGRRSISDPFFSRAL